jgi:hypothetical protein
VTELWVRSPTNCDGIRIPGFICHSDDYDNDDEYNYNTIHIITTKYKGKGKIVPVLDYHAMKTYWRNGGIAPHILTSAINGDEWSVSRLGRFTTGVRARGTHWSRSGRGVEEKKFRS